MGGKLSISKKKAVSAPPRQICPLGVGVLVVVQLAPQVTFLGGCNFQRFRLELSGKSDWIRQVEILDHRFKCSAISFRDLAPENGRELVRVSNGDWRRGGPRACPARRGGKDGSVAEFDVTARIAGADRRPGDVPWT
jgi:hypothetical protein